MSRSAALRVIWRKLLIIFVILFSLSLLLASVAGSYTVPMLTFVAGNIGGYVGIHRSLGELNDAELVELASSWFGLVVPSFVGGILACVLYLLFISGIVSGELFPKIVSDSEEVPKDFNAIFHHHAEGAAAYAKLLFWAFVAGFNQKYVVDVIESIKSRQ